MTEWFHLILTEHFGRVALQGPEDMAWTINVTTGATCHAIRILHSLTSLALAFLWPWPLIVEFYEEDSTVKENGFEYT